MTENRFAHEDAPRTEAATDEPASFTDPAPAAAAEEPAADTAPDGFAPVPVRHRRDGWTPERQRAFLDALADTGLVGEAAARVDMTRQSVARLRRRADAHAFDLACDGAMRHAAKQLRAIAFERAIEGTIRRRYYHGELVAEERVYDNRLLACLLGMTAHLIDEPEEARAVAGRWEPWVEALEHDLPPPVLSEVEGPVLNEAEEPVPDDAEEAVPDTAGAPEPETPPAYEVWDDGDWLTNLPPPPGFSGYQEDVPLDSVHYQRLLSEEEEDAWEDLDHRETIADIYDDRYGSNVWVLRQPCFPPLGVGTLEPSAEAAHE